MRKYKLPLIFFGVIFAFIVLIGVINANDPMRMKPLKNENKVILQNAVDKLNKNLPRPFGGIGVFQKVAMENDTLEYYFSSYGDPEIDTFYENNLTELKTILMTNMFHMMNGNRDLGSKMAEMMYENGIHLKAYFESPSGRIFQIHIRDSEPKEFLNSIEQSPAIALKNSLFANLKLLELNLPMDMKTGSKVTNIAQLSLESAAIEETDILMKISVEDNTVSYSYLVTDNENVFEIWREHLDEESFRKNFVQTITEDPSMRELLRTMAMCNINYEAKYIKCNRTDSITVHIPAQLLRSIYF